MERRTRLILLAVVCLLALLSLAQRAADARLPGNDEGYAPSQPIDFSHRLHAGELEIDCLYCHGGAERSRHAGIPGADVCMNCHRFVRAPFAEVRAEEKAAAEEGREPRPVLAPGIERLYASLGLGPDGQRDGTLVPEPLPWVRVHRLPDFAYFDHRPHVNGGIACEECHGPVSTMERLRQQSTLSMGWCLDCHRTGHAMPDGTLLEGTQDCAACHY